MVSRERSVWGAYSSEKGLCFLGLPLEIRIGNDTSTFHTTYLAGSVFLLRDVIRDEPAMCTGAEWGYWEGGLRCLS